MKLIDNAEKVLKYAASIKLMTIAAVLETISIAGPSLLPDLSAVFESRTVSMLSLGFIVAGLVARFIKQEKVGI
jgi:hypothetical protein